MLLPVKTVVQRKNTLASSILVALYSESTPFFSVGVSFLLLAKFLLLCQCALLLQSSFLVASRLEHLLPHASVVLGSSPLLIFPVPFPFCLSLGVTHGFLGE